jgi:cell wall-associated NlpC family hydrolase
VLTADQRQVATEALAPAQVDAAQVQVLLDDDTPWALINRPVTDLRREPRSLAERLNQGLLGETVRVLERRDEWSWVRMQQDDYLGWMQTAALHFCSRQEVEAYQATCQVQVVAELLPANWAPAPANDLTPPPFDRAGKLPFGLRLLVERYENDLAMLRLPDGRRWWVEAAGLLPLEERPMPDPAGIAFTLEMLQRFIGVPYLWGGRTPFGYDCSGLAQACWGFMGVVLPRDADQQYQAGLPVEGKPQPGDLLFFSEQHDDRTSLRHASISHVAISLGGDEVIHATGAVWGVTYNSLDPASPIYRAWLRDNLVGVRRYA